MLDRGTEEDEGGGREAGRETETGGEVEEEVTWAKTVTLGFGAETWTEEEEHVLGGCEAWIEELVEAGEVTKVEEVVPSGGEAWKEEEVVVQSGETLLLGGATVP